MHKSSFFFPRTLRTTLARPGKLHMSRVTKHQRITWWERIDTSTWLTLLPCIMRGRLLTVRSLCLNSPFIFKKWPTGPFFCAGGEHSIRKPRGCLVTRVAALMHPNSSEYRSRPHVLTLNIPRPYPVAFEISKLLDCGLDKESLAILVSLCENGVSPEALATVVQELRREATTLWNWLVVNQFLRRLFFERRFNAV